MSTLIIPSPSEFDILRNQLRGLDQKQSIEIEYRIFVDEKEYKRLINLNEIKNENVHISVAKIKGDMRYVTEENKTTIQRKHRFKDIDFSIGINKPKLRLSFSSEENLPPSVDESDLSFDLIRNRERRNYSDGNFLYSFTKTTSSLEGIRYEIEAEFKGDIESILREVREVVDETSVAGAATGVGTGIFDLLKLNKIFTEILSPNSVIFTNSLLYISNRPTNLYRDQIKLLKNQYFVTEKLDGERSFLCGTPYGSYLTVDPTFFDQNLKFNSLTIIDGEYIKSSGRFHAFDCLCYDGKNTTEINGVNNRLSKVAEEGVIVKKIHRPMDNEDVIQWMRNTMSASEDEKSNIDGIIFTNKNGDYSRTRILKWKPVNKTTIDFHYVKEGEHFNFNVLMDEGQPEIIKINGRIIKINGVNDNDIGKIINIKRNGWILEKKGISRGIPMTKEYANNSGTFSVRYAKEGVIYAKKPPYIEGRFIVPKVPESLFTIKITNGNRELENKIVETKFEVDKFVPFRIRNDKFNPNKFSVAMDNWEDIIFPIDHKELILRIFNPEMVDYKSCVRNMKYKIFGLIPRRSSVLDIGTGFGGDLNKYEEMKVSKVISIEPSEKNYDELLRRYGTGRAIRNYSFELIPFNTSMEEYEKKIHYDVVVAMLSMNFFFRKSSNSLGKLFSLIASSNLFIGAFMDSDHLQKLMNNGDNKYYYVTPSKVEKGSPITIRIGDTIVENQIEYAMNIYELISEWKFFSSKNKISGFKIYKIMFKDHPPVLYNGGMLPSILNDLYNSYNCLILSKDSLEGMEEFIDFPEYHNIRNLFIYSKDDTPIYDHEMDETLSKDSKGKYKKRMFNLDWYRSENDRVFQTWNIRI